LGFEPKDAGSIPAGSVFNYSFLWNFFCPPTVFVLRELHKYPEYPERLQQLGTGKILENIAQFFCYKQPEKEIIFHFF
jgi:hypothetical protein